MAEESPRWQWVPKARRFRNLRNGQWISSATAHHWADLSLEASESRARALWQLLADGKIEVGAWESRFREILRKEYVKQFLEGIGGETKLTLAMRGSLGGMLKEQYGWLSKFAREIAEGKLSPAQIWQRMVMYVNSAREARNRAEALAAKAAGFDEVLWKRNPAAESCEDCIQFEVMGWQKIEPWPFTVGGKRAFPGSGHTMCLTACRCGLNFRRFSGSNRRTGRQ